MVLYSFYFIFVNVGTNRLSDEESSTLAKVLPHCKLEVFGCEDLPVTADLVNVIKHSKLTRLQNLRVSPDLLKTFIQQLPLSLKSLSLNGNRVNVEHLKVLCQEMTCVFQNLIQLDLSFNDYSDEGLAYLIQQLPLAKNLKQLDVSGNRYDEGDRLMYGLLEILELTCLEDVRFDFRDVSLAWLFEQCLILNRK